MFSNMFSLKIWCCIVAHDRYYIILSINVSCQEHGQIPFFQSFTLYTASMYLWYYSISYTASSHFSLLLWLHPCSLPSPSIPTMLQHNSYTYTEKILVHISNPTLITKYTDSHWCDYNSDWFDMVWQLGWIFRWVLGHLQDQDSICSSLSITYIAVILMSLSNRVTRSSHQG